MACMYAQKCYLTVTWLNFVEWRWNPLSYQTNSGASWPNIHWSWDFFIKLRWKQYCFQFMSHKLHFRAKNWEKSNYLSIIYSYFLLVENYTPQLCYKLKIWKFEWNNFFSKTDKFYKCHVSYYRKFRKRKHFILTRWLPTTSILVIMWMIYHYHLTCNYLEN